jgi:hypothetical protein
VTEAQYSFIPPAIELDNRLPSNANLSEKNQAITHNDNYACAPI